MPPAGYPALQYLQSVRIRENPLLLDEAVWERLSLQADKAQSLTGWAAS
jgi:hypothetical protein